MTDRVFTAAEVNALIPKLAGLMRTAMERHGQALPLQRELREAQQRVRLAGGARIDQERWKTRAERLDGLRAALRGALEAIEELGGVTKDLELGLVDFPGRLPEVTGGEPVSLCWKHGETSVRFWHGLDEGYAHRKPLP